MLLKPASLSIALSLALLSPLCNASAEVTYERDVRPILKVHCFGCHGEASELAGGLDLRLRRLITAGGDSGEAIVPGKPDRSLLVDYIRSGEMPPKEELKLADDEVTTIVNWIQAGAPTDGEEPQDTPKPGALLITAQERSHWAYRPIRAPSTPADLIPEGGNAIDGFIGRRLEASGLRFSSLADRRTLIRRATMDLTGLPPTPDEVVDFVNDPSPTAYVKLIERLLASPHYGERWGRHWLDAAGYADSEGYNDKDLVRDDAWRYRDYVIRSLNADKPWDQFIVEQLAGDELVRATHANAQQLANTDEQALESLTATGYLRMAPDGSGSSPADALIARNQAVTETLKVVSTSLLGTSLACAECHHHRFDPIPQEDFYRFRAIFAPVFDLQNWRMPKSRRLPILSSADKALAEEVESNAKQLDEEHNRLKQEALEIVLSRVLEEIPAERREFAREAFATPKSERSDQQRQFCEEEFPMLGLLRTGTLHLFLARYKDGDDLKKKYEEALAKAAELRKTKPAPDYIRVATEVPQQTAITKLFYRGDPSSPHGDPLEPGGLTVLRAPLSMDPSSLQRQETLPTTGRRLAYARLLTSGRHPLVARVLVNRFWQHHFGRGLVDTPGDFGRQGSEPSHPELLDWLATDFMQHGWKLKRLHRQILTSHTWRQSSRRRPSAEALDEENRLLWRMPMRRLEAEAVRDSMLAVSGQLNRELGGPPVSVGVTEGGIVEVAGGADTKDGRKRSVYVQTRRSQPVAMLDAFDSPQMEPNCHRRVVSTVATQSLALLNSDFALQQATALAKSTFDETHADTAWPECIPAFVKRLWLRVYGRQPNATEWSAAKAFLVAQTRDIAEATGPSSVSDARLAAMASLAQVLMGSNEFLYVD